MKKQKISVKDIPDDKEINKYLTEIGIFEKKDTSELVGKVDWHHWTLEELGLPSSKDLLKSVRKIEKLIGIESWVKQNYQSAAYKGFSLTYNKDFKNKERSIYHQTLGDSQITNSYSRILGGQNVANKKNTYYDSLAFRNMHEIIRNEFSSVFSAINGAIVRSRVAYLYSSNFTFPNTDASWHIDELSTHMIRLIIPIKTSDNFFVKINGDDGAGNHYNDKHYPKEDNLYIWNQRIQHTVGADRQLLEHDPRIYFIIGIAPWLNYFEEGDYFETNENYKKPISDIIMQKLWLK